MITGSSGPGILGIGIRLFMFQRGKPKAPRRFWLNAQAEADFRASGERERVSGRAPASQQPVVRKRSSQHRSVKCLAVRSGPGAGLFWRDRGAVFQEAGMMEMRTENGPLALAVWDC